MHLRSLALPLFSLALLAKGPDVQILERSLNLQLPSASAMTATRDGFLVVGDDSPFLFRLDRHFGIVDKSLLKEYPVGTDGRIPKAIKPDFEAMTDFSHRGRTFRLIIGSGSKAPRQLAMMLSADGTERIEKNMAPFYTQLAAAAGFPAGTLVNLEGLAFSGGHFILMNRVNSVSNVIFKVRKMELINYLTGAKPTVEGIQTFHVTLPKIQGYEAGLSGADYVLESGLLFFTSSVEVTGDPINDGKILGSFIGCMELEDLKDGMDLTRFMTLVAQAGSPVITKIESIAVLPGQDDDDEMEVAVASDMDNGTSEFFRLKLRR